MEGEGGAGVAAGGGCSHVPPQLLDFQAINLSDGWWRLQGTVTDDEPPMGMVVRFGGDVYSLPPGSVTPVFPDGGGHRFQMDFQLHPADVGGAVTAQTTDLCGLDSILVWNYIRPVV
jgi:hypothetical protein